MFSSGLGIGAQEHLPGDLQVASWVSLTELRKKELSLLIIHDSELKHAGLFHICHTPEQGAWYLEYGLAKAIIAYFEHTNPVFCC